MAIVEASEKSGALGSNEAEMTEAVFKFARTQARTIMTPRVEIVFLSMTKTFEQNLEITRKSGYTRYPLVESDADHIVGMVHIKDLLAIASNSNPDIRSVVRPITKAPETKQIDDLLKEMQLERRQQAIIMDEYGGTSGLVTLEDILEELVGEIHDEHGRPADIENESSDEWLVMSSTPIVDVVEKLNLELETPPDYESIGGYLVHQLGLGELNSSILLDRYLITVAQKDGFRIHRLRFQKALSPISDKNEI
jgi:CBS domain containing-hemolysin-like protein